MAFDKYLIFAIFCRLTSGSAPNSVFLDLNEINLVQYDVKIEDNPIVVDPLDKDSIGSPIQDDFIVIPMTNKHGQKYQCEVPKPKDYKEDGENLDPSKVDGESEEILEMSDLEKAKKLLEPMASQPCLLRTKDWWTYEFCYGKSVRQFHMEEGKPSGPILHLGHYDYDKELDEDLKNSETKIKRHHTQIYANGSQCDLTGNARQTEVRFECDPTSVMDAIIQVDEPQSCAYVLTVLTSKICAIPHLRPPAVHKPVKIECRPLLTLTEYDKYQNHLKVKEINAAKKAEEVKDKHRASLLKALDGEDISHIDVTTDEGMNTIEEMVGGKLADKLVNELGAIFGKPLKPTTKWIEPETGGESFEVEEIKLSSGEVQSKPVEKNAFQALVNKFAKSAHEPKKKVVNLDPRSDLSNEDEMIQELVDTVKKMSKDEMDALSELKSTLQKNVQDSLEDIVDETEGEMNMKLDGIERHNAINELTSTFQELMSKLDKAEADINKVNEEIEQLHDTIDGKEEVIDTLKKGILDDDNPENKNDHNPDKSTSQNTMKEETEEEEDMDTKVNIKVTNFGASSATALKDSPSEKRVIKHLERAIKNKLFKAGLDTGGRQIEVKFITTSIPSEVFGANEKGGDGIEESMTSEEARQFQGMIYNLMVGNQDAYEDIDNQRKTEKSYHFAASEFEKTADETDTKINDVISNTHADDENVE